VRIKLLVEEARVHDAAIILETLGFVADEKAPEEAPTDGVRKVIGEFPERNLGDLQQVDGIRDWFILPAEEKPDDGWPWSQKPETD